MKIYIVEEEPDLLDSMSDYIYSVALSFAKAQLLINVYEYVCVIIDRNLSDGNSIDLVQIIRKNYPNASIIVMTVNNAPEDKIAILNLGADDYTTKPIHFEELNAPILSVKRIRNSEQTTTMSFHEVSIVPDKQNASVHDKEVFLTGKAFVYDKEVQLTGKEYELLYYFLVNKNRVLSKGAIYKHLRGEDVIDDSYDFIYVHIKNLRKKLIDAGAKDYIKNLYRIGYKFSDQ